MSQPAAATVPRTAPVLGVVADDFTGATDVASMLVRAGMRTVQVIGVPEGPAPEADAVVVALKSRTTPAGEAVRESLAALAWLRQAGARQFYFKYCSTFDSTPAGNIGPVTEAMMAALDSDFTIACPAFPENGRTIFRGHLFVGDQLLSDSGMRNHPLTPMTDANLVRVLQAQMAGRVGLLRHDVVARGVAAVREAHRRVARRRRARWRSPTRSTNDDLRVLGAGLRRPAAAHRRLGPGAGPARRCTASAAGSAADTQAAGSTAVAGLRAVLSGSCSVGHERAGPGLARRRAAVRSRSIRARWRAASRWSTAPLHWARDAARPRPGAGLRHGRRRRALQAVQAELGAEHAGALVERAWR